MIIQKQQKAIYRTFGILSLVAVVWVTWNLHVSGNTPAVCLFRHVTGIPCPSCGMTHSIMAIFQFQFNEALQQNILGFAAVLLLIIVPPLLLVDYILNKTYFISVYNWGENQIKKRLFISVPLTLVVVVNWMVLIFRS